MLKTIVVVRLPWFPKGCNILRQGTARSPDKFAFCFQISEANKGNRLRTLYLTDPLSYLKEMESD